MGIAAWHWTDGSKLRDGTPLEEGRTYVHEGKLKLCEDGYHASRRIMDALKYAPGYTISRVVLGGEKIEGHDRYVAERCTVHWMVDAERLLHEFACRCAEDALSQVDQPDERSVTAIRAKRQWLDGDIDDEELQTARIAAMEAGIGSVRENISDWAAIDSAYGAAGWNPWDAYRAARSAGVAYMDDACDKQNRRLTAMVSAVKGRNGQ